MPPFDKKEVRQAFSYAMDRKRFAETILQGVEELAQSALAEALAGLRGGEELPLRARPRKAKSLLAAAGSPAIDAQINYSTSDAEPSQFAQVIQADFQKLGAKMANNGVDTAALQDMSMKVNYKGVILRFSGFASTDPALLLSTSSYWRAANNGSGFKSEKYDQLVRAVSS